MRIAAEVIATILAHAREADPDECCGLLLGQGDVVREAARATNRAANPRQRYEIDPIDHFAAIRRARAAGLEVVGAYHSHPRSTPVPSETDRAEAFENFLFVIAGRAEPTGADRLLVARAWRFSSGNFVELPLVSDL